MRIVRASLVNSVVCAVLVFVAGCKHNEDGATTDGGAADACEGLGCSIVNCKAKVKPATSVSGSVFAPNGTLPLYGVTVYVPMTDPGPLPAGVQCDRCANGLQGGAWVQTQTDE